MSRLAPCLASLLIACAAYASGDTVDDRLALVGATVIDPGDGRPLPSAVVLVAGGKIEDVRTSSGEIPAGYRTIDLSGLYLLPGLIDSHVHISDFDAARRALRSGVTTARSMGVSFFADVGLRRLAADGRIESPEILAAGYHVRPQPAGALFIDEPGLGDLMSSGVHGANAMRRLAEAMVARQVDWVKVTATDRAGLPETDPRRSLYDREELAALVEAAAAAGIPVAAHAHGDDGARAAVEAGVRSIEHGTYLSAETLALMAERGTYLVPTLAVVADLTIPGGDYDNPVLQVRGRHMLPRVRKMAAEAHRRGVAIAAATDTGYGEQSVLRMSHELLELVGIGLTPLEAIRSATTVAAELLAVEERTGQIAAGFEADLIVIDDDPLADIGAFQDVLMVINDGHVVVNRLEW